MKGKGLALCLAPHIAEGKRAGGGVVTQHNNVLESQFKRNSTFTILSEIVIEPIVILLRSSHTNKCSNPSKTKIDYLWPSQNVIVLQMKSILWSLDIWVFVSE